MKLVPPETAFYSRMPATSEMASAGEIEFSELEFFEQIGEGAYGVVYKGRWRNAECAIKKMKTIIGLSDQILMDFRQEAQVMQKLRPHVNVVQWLATCTNPTICIVTEYLAGGSLAQILVTNPETLSNNAKLKITRGVASGMLHLHMEQLVHRDLSARNVLLTETYEAKIGDFGLSRLVQTKTTAHVTKSDTGPLKWMAPESLKSKEFSTKSDVWSFAVVLKELYHCCPPWPTFENFEVATLVLAGTMNLDIPPGIPVISDLMKDCFAWKPEQRPDFGEICARLNDLGVTERGEFFRIETGSM